MKHFVIEITYIAPAERIDEVRPDHRTFLQTGYEKGWLLCSGPTQAKPGGLVVARAPSLDEIMQFFKQDPYAQQGVATHTFMEFDPVMRQDFLEEWATG